MDLIVVRTDLPVSMKTEDALQSLLETCKGHARPRDRQGDLQGGPQGGPSGGPLSSPRLWSSGPYTVALDSALGGVYWLHKDSVSKDLMQMLVLEPKTMPNQWAPKIKCFYVNKSKPDFIGIPRFLGLSIFGPAHKDIRTCGLPMTSKALKEIINLRPLQQRALAQTLETLRQWGGATIVADCGFGKTRLAIGLALELGLKTMILCNREVLMLQWASVIQELTPWTISWLQGSANFTKATIKTDAGVLLGPSTKCDVCIASIDTLVEGHVPKDILQTFGLVIVDEAHHLAAASLVHALPLLPARNIVCMSATPDRRDGLEHALYWLGGPASFVYKRLPSITGLKHTVLVTKIVADGCRNRETIYANGTLAFAQMLTDMSEDIRRNKILLDTLVDLLPTRRKIIVVSALVAHCTMLRDSMLARVPADKVALMAGSTTESSKAKSPDTVLVFATYGLLEEGYDDPVLDTLVLATPRSRIQQTIGRIERSLDGKLRPLVVDLVDPFSVYPNMWHKRAAFYKSRGFEIT